MVIMDIITYVRITDNISRGIDTIGWANNKNYDITAMGHSLYCSHIPLYQHVIPLRWRHNDRAGVSNHQPHGCLLNRLFRRRLKKTSKLRVTGLCAGNSPGPVNSPHKGPVTRKLFPLDDVIMQVINFGDAVWLPTPWTSTNDILIFLLA